MNANPHDARLVSLSESGELGAGLARVAGIPLAALEERQFEAGEFKLRPLESVRGRRVFVVQSLCGSEDRGVSERFVRLLFLLATLRDAGAADLVAVVPYVAFARKDRRTQPRDPINTRYVAELIEAAHATRVVALDIHNPAALDNAFRIPVDHLSALPMFADHFATLIGNAAIATASPDVGGIKRVQIFRELLQARLEREIELAFIEKRRVGGVVSGGTLVGAVASGSTVVVLDDLCATGGTLVRAAQACRDSGAGAVHVAVTHAPVAEGIDRLLACDAISGIVVTDSVGSALRHTQSSAAGSKLTVLPVAPLLGEALRRMTSGVPLAPLLRSWPVPRDG